MHNYLTSLLRSIWNRAFLADTVAMVVFSTIAGMALELVIVGLTFGQSLHARMVAAPINVLTGGVYGKFRTWIVRATNAKEEGRLSRIVADVFAFVAFQVPLYIGILLFSGANGNQILTACMVMTAFSLFVGRPLGIVMDLTRKLFRV